jgi:predicted O-methyltransferase YrrM
MNSIIQEIYQNKRVVDGNGTIHELQSSVDPAEGKFLFEMIRNDPGIKKTLEVGCAHGLSSLHICEALKDRIEVVHTIIDPFQNTHWRGIGVTNLKRNGVGFFQLIEERSEFALPRLCQQGEERFDFIFIDGFHTFDHTLVDCFFATRLLRTGGYLVVDDVSWQSVGRCMRYFANYPCYRVHGAITRHKPQTWKRQLAKTLRRVMPESVAGKIFSAKLIERVWHDTETMMIALKKVSKDERDWMWYADF